MSEVIDCLRGLVGREVHYDEKLHEIIEVLSDGPDLVLIEREADHIQATQYGQAHRRTPATVTVPAVSAPDQLHAVILAVADDAELARLRNLIHVEPA